MTPEIIQKRLALKLKLNKIDNCGIVAPILLNELLLKIGYSSSKLTQGYCSLSNETCWHIWVELEGRKLDIGYTLACLKDSEFEKCTTILHTNLAQGVKVPEQDTETLDMWELYQENPKEYWKKQHVKLKNFRSKMFSQDW